jgi:hypothetical protein
MTGIITGIDYAGASVALKAFGFWDDEHDSVPAHLMWGLQVLEREIIRLAQEDAKAQGQSRSGESRDYGDWLADSIRER